MKLLEDRIRRDGVVKDGDVLKVDSFLNHQMDVELFAEMGREWAKLFAADYVTKILTIEASGIGIACLAAGDVYTAKVESFTHGRVYDIIVAKQFLNPGDRVLIIDDFLAKGAALQGLIQLVRESGATLVGAGIAVEKAFQTGGDLIRGMGVRVESLARIKSMGAGGIEFC